MSISYTQLPDRVAMRAEVKRLADTTSVVYRYGYLNTDSQAGRGEWYGIRKDRIEFLTVWVNSNGNPTTRIHLTGGDHITCVDDFGCENNLTSKPRYRVNRRKDL